MPTISGRLIYDVNRTTVSSGSLLGIANVPIVLQNTTTNETLAVLTTSNGNYSFINVPNGNYQIVEKYGFQGAIASPGDFTTAIIADLLNGGTVPPLSYITNPPIDATNLDCTTPNTLLITISGSNISNLNILNGPVKYTPITEIMDQHIIVSPDNLVDIADDGTFGSFAPGTPSLTFASSTYTGIGEGFTFVQTVPHDGQYAIENITSPLASSYTWWSFADHTTGNETGRAMIINGDNPGALLFNETVAVKPNTYYLFSAWILNMIKVSGYQAPAFGVRLIDNEGHIIIEQTLGQEVPVNRNEPEWVQIGSIIYTGNDTSITIQFISQGPAALGNDYALDDVLLAEVITPPALPLVKSINTNNAVIDDIVTYTVTMTNTYTYAINKVNFKDLVPDGLEFVNGTLKINGTTYPAENPNNGIALPDVNSGETITVEFDAKVISVPNPNPTINTAQASYEYTFIQGGIPTAYTVESNEVPLAVELNADLGIVKTTLQEHVGINEVLVYILTIHNYGPASAQNVVVTDAIPYELRNVEYSIDGGLTWNYWNGAYTIGALSNNATFTILIRGIVTSSSGVIINTARVTSTTPDPNPDNNHYTDETPIYVNADLSVIKTACPIAVAPCKLITYTIIVSNAGPNEAIDVVLNDKISNLIYNVVYSLDNGQTWHPWYESVNLGNLNANSHLTVLIRGYVKGCATGEINNIAYVYSQTHDANHHNNRYEITTKIKKYCWNE